MIKRKTYQREREFAAKMIKLTISLCQIYQREGHYPGIRIWPWEREKRLTFRVGIRAGHVGFHIGVYSLDRLVSRLPSAVASLVADRG